MDELREIKERLRGKISQADFWTSKGVQKYLTDLAKATIDRYGVDFDIEVSVEFNPNGAIAYTTFNKVVINAACNQIQKLVKGENQLLYIKGLLAHEMAHILYMDKGLDSRYQRSLRAGLFLPRFPMCEKQKRQDILDSLADKQKNAVICSIASNLINIIEDGYGENTYIANYYGSMVDGMKYMRKEFYKDLPLSSETEAKFAKGGKDEFSGCFDILLQYALYHRLHDDGFYPMSEEVLKLVKPLIDRSLSEDFRGRLNTCNEIIVALWDYIKLMLDDDNKDKNKQQQNQDSKAGVDNGSDSNNSGNPNNSNGKPNKPQGNGAPVCKPENQASPQPSNDDGEESLQQAFSDFEDMMEQALDEAAKQALEQQNIKRANQEANNGTMGNYRVFVERPIEITNDMIRQYEEYSEILEVSRRIQKSIKKNLDDIRKGGKKSGLYIGRKVEVRQVIRNDGKCFYNNKLPQFTPRIVVAMLVDESMSMNAMGKNGLTRVENAKRTAIIVEDFCRSLDFPIMIVGTTADFLHERGSSELSLYCSFSSVDKMDRYRLVNIKAKSCNRDGAALKYVYDELKKRPEEIKILFSISDGKPNAFCYGGESACNELRSIHQQCINSGIVTFAAAIGEDKKQIEGIYGNSFLDISNFDEMPKLFIDRIKKFIRR